MPQIEISDQLYSRLEEHAVGFDTPAAVIERLLNRYEGESRNHGPRQQTSSVKRRDTTKYLFDGYVLPKNRLVLAVVKRYVEEHAGIAFADLEKVFPGDLQGSMGVFSRLDDAEQILERSGYKRHFLRPEEQISLADGKIAVCTQWGAGNIGTFVERARELGYEITESS